MSDLKKRPREPTPPPPPLPLPPPPQPPSPPVRPHFHFRRVTTWFIDGIARQDLATCLSQAKSEILPCIKDRAKQRFTTFLSCIIAVDKDEGGLTKEAIRKDLLCPWELQFDDFTLDMVFEKASVAFDAKIISSQQTAQKLTERLVTTGNKILARKTLQDCRQSSDLPDVVVTITGESGIGKTLMAIHESRDDYIFYCTSHELKFTEYMESRDRDTAAVVAVCDRVQVL
eukprot:PhF_6_TR23820/c2_g1_i1/m.33374